MKTRKQGLNVTTKQLRKLANDLDKEEKDFYLHLRLKKTKFIKSKGAFKWLIRIINKTPNYSDTWELDGGTIK
ncbi:MAG: hypothetical protein AABW88_03275 [Nanoarchaeota archaeon]